MSVLEHIKIITTEDGSHSLIRLDMNESYHSFRGAIAESQHVFIEAGLQYWLEREKKEDINVFEVGFGTGLNAWLTYLFAKTLKGYSINYHSIEKYPLSEEIAAQLNFTAEEIFLQFHTKGWNHPLVFENFNLIKTNEDLANISLEKGFYDIIFFDAFAPSKQPEMWSLKILTKCYHSLNSGGVLVTYCAQGQFKRNLKSLGFEVQILPGALGKKEMVRALKS